MQTHINIPPKILKSSFEDTVNVFHRPFNETITKGVFLDNLKLADITPTFKKDGSFDKKTSDLSAFYPLYSKFMKN